jgi:AraC-like DNA-binding protein
MNEKKPHLDPEITLSSLADLVSVSPEYLSKMINNQLGKNFYDFINHYRIEEFKTRCTLPENKNFTLISIAFDCGFNSKPLSTVCSKMPQAKLRATMPEKLKDYKPRPQRIFLRTLRLRGSYFIPQRHKEQKAPSPQNLFLCELCVFVGVWL